MDLADLRHLLRRLTFAATPAMEREFRDVTADRVVATLFGDARKAALPAAPDVVRGAWRNSALRVAGMTAAQYDSARAAQTIAAQQDIERLRQWWLGEMAGGAAPLRENLVLFFQGVFGSSTTSVDIAHALYGCNALVREASLGTIPALLDRLVLDAAMMMQIGMDDHGKERVSDRPAKLILDHWTVGAGEYSDADVENLSRALTGWQLAAPRGQEPSAALDPQAARPGRRTGLMPAFDPQQFDRGSKTILGTTRDFDARSAMALLAQHPATARRFSRQLLRFLGVEDPRQRLEARLAATYAATGGSVEALVRDVVTSREFSSAESRWTLIKSPVHLAVGACRQLEIASPPLAGISRWSTAAGQTLFDTPNSGEGGWPGDRAWVTPPDRLAIRYQLPVVLSGRVPPLGIRSERQAQPSPMTVRVGASLQNASAAALLARLDPAPGLEASRLQRGASEAGDRGSEIIRLVMMTPEYQVA
jgi:uncharacterized protein (DUF1800 family)